jgi:spoIIIJ-associated protein
VAHAEASARTVDAAVTAAAAQLGLRPDQVDIEVLEDPVPSTFGYVGTPARVRVTPRPAPTPGPASAEGPPSVADPVSASASVAASAPVSAPAPVDAVGRVSPPGASDAVGRASSPGSVPASDHAPVAPEGSADARSLASDPPPAGSQAGSAGVLEPTAPGSPVAVTGSTEPGPALAPAPAPTPPSAPEISSGTNLPEATAQEASIVVSDPDNGQPPAATQTAGRLETPPTDPQVPTDPQASTDPRAPAPAQLPASASSPAMDATGGLASAPEEPSRATRSPRRAYRDEPIEPQMVEEDTERAGDFLEGLLDALDVDGDITTWVDEVGGHIDLEGSDLDALIGPNGETLDSLQELTRLAVLRQSKRRVRLLIDINGFRARQRDKLTSIVRVTAEQVVRTREDHEFQPMTPAERKIVHDAVAEIDGVRTESLGEEPNRRVVIRPA